MISPERSPSQSPRSPAAAAGSPFLSVSVTDPVKMGTGVQAYISYRVITKKMDRARSYETGIFKKPADFLQMFKDVQSKVSDVVLGKEKPVEESTPEYEKLKNYIFELENHLAEAQKQAYRLVKRHRELGLSLAEFGKAIKLLGACEGDVMEKVFSEVGSKSEMLSIKLQREADNLLFNFEEPLKDYVRAVQSIKATMIDRANAFRQHFDLDQERKYKELNLEKLKFMNPEKYAEAESEFREAIENRQRGSYKEV
nr:unnamed protein product [Digitaria exilis]